MTQISSRHFFGALQMSVSLGFAVNPSLTKKLTFVASWLFRGRTIQNRAQEYTNLHHGCLHTEVALAVLVHTVMFPFQVRVGSV